MDFMDLHKRTKAKPAVGRLLIAEPFLSDPGFSRTVILLCEHNENGTVGFVLNKPSAHRLKDLLPEIVSPVLPVFDGGPVQKDTLHMLHAMPGEMGGHEVLPGVYWGASYEDLNRVMQAAPQLKTFLGYSGWDVGQLDAELEQGSWLVADASKELIFDVQPGLVWQSAIRSLGSEFAYMAHMPPHPQMN